MSKLKIVYLVLLQHQCFCREIIYFRGEGTLNCLTYRYQHWQQSPRACTNQKMSKRSLMKDFRSSIKGMVVLFLIACISSDSIIAQQPESDSSDLHALIGELKPQLQNKQLDSITFQHLHSLLTTAIDINDSTAIAQLYYSLAEWHNFHYDYFEETNDSAIVYDKLAITYFTALDSIDLLINLYYYLALDLSNLMRTKEAEEAAFEGIRLAEAHEDQEMLPKFYINLGRIYCRIQDTSKALEYTENAIALLQNQESDYFTLIAYAELAAAYNLNAEYQKAIDAATTGIESVLNIPKQDPSFDDVHIYQHRANAYFHLKEYNNAISDYNQSLLISDQYLDGLMNPLAYTGLARVYRAQGKYQEALGQLRKAESYTIKYGDETGYFSSEMAQTLTGLGRYKAAIPFLEADHLDKITTLKTKIQSLESELLVKYESQQKDRTIQSQLLQIQQNNKIQWLSFGILALLISILGVLFWFYRNNKRKNLQLLNLNQTLASTNAQKELLLKEIHHRVKNNLQTISSLLSLQSVYIDNPEVLGAVAKSQDRVQSMGLIHQKLYQGEKLAVVEMKDYLRSLSERIIDAYGIDTEQIQISFPMEEVEMDVDNAIPLGLIANELITNAFKYAFPEKRNGKVEISLKKVKEGEYSFLVEDDGVGKKDHQKKLKMGFGTQLVQMLVQQINGHLQVQSENGMVTKIQFTLD